jgi:sugar transferase (PEP-CTERM/EpsH1 system associated)
MQDRPALVFLCQRLPYAPTKGERIQSYNILRHLARRYRVFVGTFIDDPFDAAHVDDVRAMAEDVHVANVTRVAAFFRGLAGWLTGQPASFSVFRSRSLGRWLDEIEAAQKPIAVVAHSSNVSTYAVDRFGRKGTAKPARILHFSDVDSEKFASYARNARGFRRMLFKREAALVRREEIRLGLGADAVGFVSDEETELFRSIPGTSDIEVFTMPNGVDTAVFDPCRYPQSPFRKSGPTLMFTGAMDYPPNIEAVAWFGKDVLPGIRAHFPEVRFMIVGSNPTASVKRLTRDASVIVTGRVESTAAYLAHADIAVAPLRVARGVQNKVLEAMAMARPVVASDAALTGISAVPGEHVFRASSPHEWIETCTALLGHPAKALETGARARTLVEGRHAWPVHLATLDRLLGAADSMQNQEACVIQ